MDFINRPKIFFVIKYFLAEYSTANYVYAGDWPSVSTNYRKELTT